MVNAYLIIVLAVGSFAGGVWYAAPEKLGPGFARVKNRQIVITGAGAEAPDAIKQKVNFGEYWDLWNGLKDKFYKQPVDDAELFYGSLEGMAASLKDPYTVFFRPKDAEEFSKEIAGTFSGIGAEIGIKHDALVVVHALPDTPAARAGLRTLDAILAIDGVSTSGMAVDAAVGKIRGPKGTEVKLTLLRGAGAPFEVKIVRDNIQIKSVTWKMETAPGGAKVAHVSLTQFNGDTQGLLDQAIREFLGEKPAGVILDMRGNPGGYFDAAVSVAGEWVTNDVIAYQKYKDGSQQEFRSRGKARLAGTPTVVLINEGSASATEIVTGALQDAGVATVVGEKSFGKGLVQDLENFPDGSSLKITVAQWTTPKGRFINEIGIIPDVLVSFNEDDYNADRDPQLDAALRLFAARTVAPLPGAPRATSTPADFSRAR